MAHAPATAPPWELALVPMPEAFATKSDWPAILLVVEARSGAVRFAEPVMGPQGLKAAFSKAITQPLDGLRAGRPRSVACPQGLLAVLQPALSALGLVCHGAHRLPAAEAAVAAMVAELATATMPARDIGWEGVLRSLLRPMPWSALGADVGWRLRSDDPTYDELVISVFRGAGSAPVLLIYPSEVNWRAVGPQVPPDDTHVPVIQVNVVPGPPIDPGIRTLLPHAGVDYEGARLSVYRLGDGIPVVPPVEAQRSLLTACAAVLDLLTSDTPWPAVGAPPVTLAGPRGLRVEQLSLLPQAAHSPSRPVRLREVVEYALFSELRALNAPQAAPDRLVLRARKADTAGLITTLEAATAARLRRVGTHGWELTLTLHTGMVMLLGMLPLIGVPETTDQGTVTLVVAMGGAKAQVTAARERLWETSLPCTVLCEDGRPFAAAMAALPPGSPITSASWDGAPEGWPPVDQVLHALLTPLLPPETAWADAKALLMGAAALWVHHALEAEGRESWHMRHALDVQMGRWLAGQLVARRQRLFAKDIRHVHISTIIHEGVEGALRIWSEPLRDGARPR